VLSTEPGSKGPVATRRVFMGPANPAGQGYAWARAISKHCRGAIAANFTFKRGRLDFPADNLVSAEQFRHDAAWAEEFRAYVGSIYTHAVLESNRPVFGARQPDALADIGYLRDAGLGVALMAHGSDVRIPAAGRIVVSHVSNDVREHVRQRTGVELPIMKPLPRTFARPSSALPMMLIRPPALHPSVPPSCGRFMTAGFRLRHSLLS
jgi:hypothetical protein